jgi:sialate O-acetylesterase
MGDATSVRQIAVGLARAQRSRKRKGEDLLTFDNVGTGLKIDQRRSTAEFAIAGRDKKWVWAEAKIVGKDKVEVWSPDVPAPVAVRYAFQQQSEAPESDQRFRIPRRHSGPIHGRSDCRKR